MQERTSLPDGSHVEPVLEKGGAAHDAFLKQYLDKNDSALQTYYRSLVFTGKGSMPKAVGTDADVVAYVAKTKGSCQETFLRMHRSWCILECRETQSCAVLLCSPLRHPCPNYLPCAHIWLMPVNGLKPVSRLSFAISIEDGQPQKRAQNFR